MLICPLTVVPVIVTTGCSVSVSSRWELSLEETLHLWKLKVWLHSYVSILLFPLSFLFSSFCLYLSLHICPSHLYINYEFLTVDQIKWQTKSVRERDLPALSAVIQLQLLLLHRSPGCFAPNVASFFFSLFLFLSFFTRFSPASLPSQHL